jgi:ppGpp synthetase/RelA/SpoT-type nucleotidyltranferase
MDGTTTTTKYPSDREDDNILVYKPDDAAFSLLKPYLEFNELDLQQLFGKQEDDAPSSSSFYDDIQEVKIGHYPKNGIASTNKASSASPFYFCQHKQPVTLPPWLSLLNPSMATSKLSALRRDLSPHLSPKQISTVMEALRAAAKSDVQLAGVAEFCSLLVNSLEMSDVAALIGSAFHYCSLVGLREREMQMPQSPNQEDGDVNHLDTKYLCALAGSGIESYSPHAMKIALDAARLKSMEATAAQVVKTCPQTSANLRSLLLSVNEVGDWRALAVRSAACLYRLRGLRKWRESGLAGDENGRTEEEKRVGHEALHIYAPLAARLGMFRLKTELEDAAFRTLYPHSHSTVSSLCDTAEVGEGMKSVLSDISNQMKRLVQEDLYFMENIDNVSITARLKEPYSIWRKMVKMSKRGDRKLSDISILDIPDAVALRVVFSARKLTEDESDLTTQRREQQLCYYILNLCTETWPETSSSRFKDYVAKPKENGYQSLHYSSCKRWRGSEWPFEVQIRSSDMHRVAEYGVAAHWSYKRYGIDPPSSSSKSSLTHRKILDKSSKSYLKSVQEYHSREALKSYITPEVEPDEPMYIEDEIRRGRKREREERLAPYLEALSGAQTDMTRENVYVFVSLSRETTDESSSNNMQGTVLSLPRGSRVLDAIRAAEKWSDSPSPIHGRRSGIAVLRNGRRTSEQTERLVNGDVISILSDKSDGAGGQSGGTDLVKHLFSIV